MNSKFSPKTYVCSAANSSSSGVSELTCVEIKSPVAQSTFVEISNDPSGAEFITNFVKEDVIIQNDLGNTGTPANPIMAIGPTMAIAMTNSVIGFFDRFSSPPMNRTVVGLTADFLPFDIAGGIDVQVIYDEFSSRFFILCWRLTVSFISTSSSPILKNYMNIAVSQNSSPTSFDDWYKYQLTTTYWNTNSLQADDPKITVDETNFYISTNDFGGSTYVNATVTVLKKNDLLNNTAPTFIDENSSTFVSQKSIRDFWIAQPARIVYSGYKKRLPQFFLSMTDYGVGPFYARDLDSVSGIRVFIGSSMTRYVDVPFPVPTQIDVGAVAQQPLGITATVFGLATGQFAISTAVIYKTSLFAAHTILNGTKSIIRWYEFDVSRAARYNEVCIKQWGDIDTCEPNESCFYPAINVDDCGNMAIAFTISGPNTLPTFAYTGRLKNDPYGTVRNPYQIIKESLYPYNGARLIRLFPTSSFRLNLWEDYKSLVVDPNDHKTFYAFGQYASSSLLLDGRSNRWTTAMASFNIEESYDEQSTEPGLQTCSL